MKRENLKVILCSVVLLGIFMIDLLNYFPEKRDSNIYSKEDLIRLHILANSDTEQDQYLKLLVRNKIVKYLEAELKEVQNANEVKTFICNNEEKIKEIASAVLKENHCDDVVKISMGKSEFPLKKYGKFVLPSGTYNSVKILIGEAKGANWWCVLFPPLCFIEERQVDVKNEKENSYEIIINDTQGKEVILKFKLLELYENF